VESTCNGVCADTSAAQLAKTKESPSSTKRARERPYWYVVFGGTVEGGALCHSRNNIIPESRGQNTVKTGPSRDGGREGVFRRARSRPGACRRDRVCMDPLGESATSGASGGAAAGEARSAQMDVDTTASASAPVLPDGFSAGGPLGSERRTDTGAERQGRLRARQQKQREKLQAQVRDVRGGGGLRLH
jgi:hypothetical protein